MNLLLYEDNQYIFVYIISKPIVYACNSLPIPYKPNGNPSKVYHRTIVIHPLRFVLIHDVHI